MHNNPNTIKWAALWVIFAAQSQTILFCFRVGLRLKNLFWSDGLVELNALQKSLEIVVKSVWITSWLWCATFIKTTQDTGGPVPEGGHGEVAVVVVAGDGGLVWSTVERSSEDKNQYLQGWMKIPSASKLGVWRSLAVFLLCYFLPWVPFISCQNPSFTVLILQLFIIKIENGGNHPRMDRMQLGMWHAAHDCAPSPFSELYPFLFFLPH